MQFFHTYLPYGRQRIDRRFSNVISKMRPGDNHLAALHAIAFYSDDAIPERTRQNLLFNLAEYVNLTFEQIESDYETVKKLDHHDDDNNKTAIMCYLGCLEAEEREFLEKVYARSQPV